MTIQLYNSMTRQKEAFVPLEDGKVKIYVCGPTVYDMAHIGHARSCVAFDVIVRYLRRHYDVTYVRNYTDVDDKIIKRSIEEERPSIEVSEHYIAEFKTDMAALNNSVPDHEPKVTQTMDEIVTFVQNLIDKGHAYAAEGDVYFAVQSFDGYGKLSGRSLDDMEAGARVEVNDKKRHPMDFALWKAAKPGEPKWASPWGDGRPGWHIECSAMSCQLLGMPFDIHGGGRDLIFPHHENERAQSCCGYGGSFVGTWMHNAYVDMDGEKMSKSLGNVRTVRELLEQYSGETLRFALLSAHYRSPLNFSRELLDNAQATLDGFYLALRNAGDTPVEVSEAHLSPVFNALLDDLNTPAAIAELHQLAKVLNKASESEKAAAKAALLAGGAVLGILSEDPVAWLSKSDSDGDALTSEVIDQMLIDRAEAKANRDFSRADAIRDELNAAGIIIEDSASGATWRRG